MVGAGAHHRPAYSGVTVEIALAQQEGRHEARTKKGAVLVSESLGRMGPSTGEDRRVSRDRVFVALRTTGAPARRCARGACRSPSPGSGLSRARWRGFVGADPVPALPAR